MPNNIGYVILEADNVVETKASVIKSDGRRVIAEGVLQTAEEENRNGRCYLYQDLFREITCPRTMELLSTGNLCAENGHPLDNNLVRQQTIDPDNTVARFTKLWMDGNNVMGRYKGTNNALGESFDLDLREGVLPSWSLRALGTLECIKGRNVVRNLKMVDYDRVIYPSHSGAYTKGIVSESASIIKPDNQINISLEKINETGYLLPVTNEQVISYIKTESARIDSILNQFDVFYESMQVINNGRDVQLVTKAGDTFIVNLESHIQDEIYSYCMKH